MASPTQLVQFTFAGGIDQSLRDEIVDPAAAFVSIQNGRQDGRGGLTRRRGLTALSLVRTDATSRTAGYKVFAHEKQTCVVAEGPSLDVWSPTAGKSVARGRVPECTVRTSGLPTPSATAYVYDIAYASGYVAIATGSAFVGGTTLAIVDASTGAVLRSPETVGAGDGLVVVGSYDRYFIAFVYTVSSTAITAYILDTNAISSGWSSLATVASSTGGALPSVCSLSDRVAVAYGLSSGSNRVAVKTYNASGLISSVSLGNTTTPSAISIDGSTAGNLWAVWGGSTLANVIALSPSDLSTTGAPGSAFSFSTSAQNVGICEGAGGTSARLFVFTTDTTIQLEMCTLTLSGGLLSASSSVLVYGVAPVSRPFRHGSRYYMAVAPSVTATTLDGNEQSLCVLVDWTDDVTYFRPVANVMPGLVPNEATFCKVIALSSTKYAYAFQSLRSGTGGLLSLLLGTSGTVGCTLAEFDFASTQRWTTAQFGTSTFLAGGILSVYDGERLVESGFVCSPPQPTGVDAGSGSGPNGSYRCVCVYEDVDASGNCHISGVSLPSASVSVTDNTITWTGRPLTVSSRIPRGTTRVVFYRTAAGGEPPYYRLGASANNTASATVTFSDSVADSSLTSRAKLYAPSLPGINGGAQDRRAPPGLLFPTNYNGTLVGAEGENLWYSGQDVYGEGTWFSPVFQVPVSGGGAITGLAAQDGTLYVFKRRAVYAVAGEAPTDNGAAGGLGAPRLLSVDVGCIDARSIVVTSFGVFFQSERGIELLTRAQSTEWIGEQIQSSLGAAAVVSATLDAANSLVYFELDTGSVALVYDLARRIWQSVDTRAATAASGAVVWDESQSAYRYAYLATSGALYVEGTGYLDGGSTWITMTASTGWVKLGGIQGQHIFNRALLLAKRGTSSDISLQLSYDYGAAQNATEWAATTLDALSTALGRIQIQHSAHDDAEGQSVRLTIEDSTPTGASVGTGQGATWVALTFEGQPRANAALVSEEAA